MPSSDSRHELDTAFEQIEGEILPALSLMLDSLLDAASLARPGADAAVYAAELRTIGAELEALTCRVEAASAARPAPRRQNRAA